MSNKPMVSIVVLTYNSAQYVLDTLESAYKQIYLGDLELIITDDCSTDNTVDVCRKWLETHSDRFVNTELITVAENTGVSKNANRGCSIAQGKWIKPIAGDDILMDHCIDTLINFVIERGDDCRIVSASLRVFTNREEINNPEALPIMTPILLNDKIGIKELLNGLVTITSPGMLYDAATFRSIGYYEEVFRNIEDLSTWYKIIGLGIDIYVCHTPVVLYRITPNSLTSVEISREGKEAMIQMYKKLILVHEKYLLSRASLCNRIDIHLKLFPLKVFVFSKGKLSLLRGISFRISSLLRWLLSAFR